MGEAQERYWQAVKANLDLNDRRPVENDTSTWADLFEQLGDSAEKEASLLRLCEAARDEAYREIMDRSTSGTKQKMHEWRELWIGAVADHQKHLQWLIEKMGYARIHMPDTDRDRNNRLS